MQIYVTGIGIVSALGLNVFDTFKNLKDEKSGISFNKHYNQLIGSVSMSNNILEKELNISSGNYSRSTLLGYKASLEAIAHLSIEQKSKTAFISGTSVGGIDKTEIDYFKVIDGISFNELNFSFENGSVTEDIVRLLNIKGYINTISTACSSGANAIMLGARLIQSGRYDRVLVGGVDPIASLNVSGFKSLGVYSDEICMPFDKNRKGLNLGEGAAFLLLENEKSIKDTNGSKLAEIKGFANTADAFHQTASSPDGSGAIGSMKKAIKKANLSTSDIDYINAHGTATPNNDLSESAALLNVFGREVPRFSSTKCYTGHTLAAAGAIEAVISVISITQQVIFPTFNFKTPIEETQLQPETKLLKNIPIRNILSNSFGFGGNCTSLIISKIDL